MKKSSLKKVFISSVIALSVLASNAYARNDQIAPNKTIVRVSTYDTFASIQLDSPVGDTQGCQTKRDDRVIIDLRDGKNKEVYASALAAAVSGQKVGFGVSGCWGSPLYYPTIYRIDVNY